MCLTTDCLQCSARLEKPKPLKNAFETASRGTQFKVLLRIMKHEQSRSQVDHLQSIIFPKSYNKNSALLLLSGFLCHNLVHKN